MGDNFFADHEDVENAHILWEALKTDNKPAGSGTLDDLYRQLLKLDAADFAARLKSLHNEITSMSAYLRLETNYLIFLFHTGLGKAYEGYFTHYIQTHSPMSETDATKPAHSFEYATRRFTQTVTNPSTNREESNLAMAATYTPATAGPAIPIENQNGAVPGPDAQLVQKLVKYCTHCRMHYTF